MVPWRQAARRLEHHYMVNAITLAPHLAGTNHPNHPVRPVTVRRNPGMIMAPSRSPSK